MFFMLYMLVFKIYFKIYIFFYRKKTNDIVRNNYCGVSLCVVPLQKFFNNF